MKAYQLIIAAVFSSFLVLPSSANAQLSESAEYFASTMETIAEITTEADYVTRTAFEFEAEKLEAIPTNYESVIASIQYPVIAVKAGLEGTVHMRILVNERGEYVTHIVLSSPDDVLTDAVEEQIAYMSFTPAQVNGQNETSWISLPFGFRLQN